jgi:integrase
MLAKHIAENLVLAARRWVKSPEGVLLDLDEQRRCVRVGRSDRRRRNLLAQFATPEDRKELFDLPHRAFERADFMLKQALREGTSLQAAAKLHETALGGALLFVQPIRIRNLAALDARHLKRDRQGQLARIFIDAREVKNAMPIEILLPEWLAARIERHLAVYRPVLLGANRSTALFPGRGGMPMQAHTLSERLRRIVEQQLGLHFTPHLARHLAAFCLRQM